MKDPSLEAIKKQWGKIVFVYKLHEENHPIIQYELPEERIYAYSADQYIDSLSERTREETRAGYRAAVEEGSFIVFVKDKARRTLRSYVFEVPDEHAKRIKRGSRRRPRRTMA